MEKRMQLLENLEKIFGEVYQTALKPNDLRVAIPVSDDGETAILMEVIFIDDSSLKDDSIIQIYTTIVFDFDSKNTSEILVKLNELSAKFIFGNFGVYTPMNQIYHRYSMYLPNPDSINCLQDISVVCDRIVSSISYAYDYIVKVSKDPQSITLEEYLNSQS